MKYNLIAIVYVIYYIVIEMFFFSMCVCDILKKLESNNLWKNGGKESAVTAQSIHRIFVERILLLFFFARINCIRDEVTNVQA